MLGEYLENIWKILILCSALLQNLSNLTPLTLPRQTGGIMGFQNLYPANKEVTSIFKCK